jgi:hypothetical protein
MYKISELINNHLLRIDFEGCVHGAHLADYLINDGIKVTFLGQHYVENQGYLFVAKSKFYSVDNIEKLVKTFFEKEVEK